MVLSAAMLAMGCPDSGTLPIALPELLSGRVGHLEFFATIARDKQFHTLFDRIAGLPICCFKVPGTIFVVLSDPGAIRDMFSDHDTWRLAPGGADAWKSAFDNVLVGLEGQKWALHRRVMQKAGPRYCISCTPS